MNMTVDKVEKDDVHLKLSADLMKAIRREAADTRSTIADVITGHISTGKQAGVQREDVLVEKIVQLAGEVNEVRVSLATVVSLLETIVARMSDAEDAGAPGNRPEPSTSLTHFYEAQEAVAAPEVPPLETQKRGRIGRFLWKTTE